MSTIEHPANRIIARLQQDEPVLHTREVGLALLWMAERAPQEQIAATLELALLHAQPRVAARITDRLASRASPRDWHYLLSLLRRLGRSAATDAVLDVLARRLPETLLDQALPLLPIAQGPQRSRLVDGIVGRYTAPRRGDLLRFARAIEDPALRAEILAASFRLAPAQERAALAHEIMDTAAQAGDVEALRIAFSSVAADVGPEVVHHVIKAIQEWPAVDARRLALEGLLDAARPDCREALVAAALTLGERLEDPERVKGIEAVRQNLTPQLAERGFAMLRSVADIRLRFRGYRALYRWLPPERFDPIVAELMLLQPALRVYELDAVAAFMPLRLVELIGNRALDYEHGEGLSMLAVLARRVPGVNRDEHIRGALTAAARTRQDDMLSSMLLEFSWPYADDAPEPVIEGLGRLLRNPRYAEGFLRSAARSLSGRVAIRLVVELARAEAEKGRWEGLQALLRALPASALRAVVVELRACSDAAVKAWGFAALASVPSHEGDASILQEALGHIRSVRDEPQRAALLLAIAEIAPDSAAVWASILDVIDEGGIEEGRLRSILEALAPRLPAELITRAMKLQDRMIDPSESLPAQAVLASRLDGRERVRALKRIASRLDEIRNPLDRTSILLELVMNGVGGRGMMKRALVAIRHYPAPHKLVGIVPLIPDDLADEALDAALAVKGWTSLQAVAALEERFPRLRKAPEPLSIRAGGKHSSPIAASFPAPRFRPVDALAAPSALQADHAGASDEPEERLEPGQWSKLFRKLVERLSPALEPVLLGTSAPPLVEPGDEFAARFIACVERLKREMEAQLKNASPGAATALGLRRCQWRVGTEVLVRLTSRCMTVSPEEQRFTWGASQSALDFVVSVPVNTKAGSSVLLFEVFIEGVCVTRLSHDITVGSRSSGTMTPVTRISQAHRTAFASYASEDRARVIDRVASLQISAGLDVFMDCLSLRPVDEYKPVIEEQIKARGLFLLFWSYHASRSVWVEWEWRIARQSKPPEALQPHPLDPIDAVPPPRELATLHFGIMDITAHTMPAPPVPELTLVEPTPHVSPAPAAGPVSTFICYASADTDLVKRLETHLGMIRRDKLIAPWSLGQVGAGEEFGTEARERLARARLILLLVSADFLASDEHDEQVAFAMEQHRRRAARVVPILLRRCDWEETGRFKELRVLPRNKVPVKQWNDEDEAFTQIAQELRGVVKKWRSS